MILLTVVRSGIIANTVKSASRNVLLARLTKKLLVPESRLVPPWPLPERAIDTVPMVFERPGMPGTPFTGASVKIGRVLSMVGDGRLVFA